MMMPDYLRILLLCAAVFYGLFVFTTVTGVFLSREHTVGQRIVQAMISVLIPVVGPLLVFAFLTVDNSREELKKLVPFPFYLFAYDHEKAKRLRAGHGINDHGEQDSD